MGLWVRGRLNSHRALLAPSERNKIIFLMSTEQANHHKGRIRANQSNSATLERSSEYKPYKESN